MHKTSKWSTYLKRMENAQIDRFVILPKLTQNFLQFQNE